MQKDEHGHLSSITININIEEIKKFNKLKCKQYEKAIHKMRRGISNYTSQIYQEIIEICDKNYPYQKQAKDQNRHFPPRRQQSIDVLKLFNTGNRQKNWGETLQWFIKIHM